MQMIVFLKRSLIMLRHYYISDNLDELKDVEQALAAHGITEPQIHVLSEHDGDVKAHHLPEVESVLKKDVVHSTEIGAIVGVIAAAITLLLAYTLGWSQSQAGWLPIIFLAIVILGFCTWEGGFIGIQKNNVNFERFQEVLKNDKHVLFVDIDVNQEQSLAKVVGQHPSLQPAGVGDATPKWIIKGRDAYQRFVKIMP